MCMLKICAFMTVIYRLSFITYIFKWDYRICKGSKDVNDRSKNIFVDHISNNTHSLGHALPITSCLDLEDHCMQPDANRILKL